MASLNPPVCEFGWKAPDFDLFGVDGRRWSLSQVKGVNGTLVMFICNHCPYVQSIRARLVADVHALRELGINTVAISSNDAATYPDDSFEKMAELAREFHFPFPYLYDESQEVAKDYGAVCTPDFFGFNAHLELQYRGRFDNQGRVMTPVEYPTRDLYNAMKHVAETGRGPLEQVSSIGCSIKWRETAE